MSSLGAVRKEARAAGVKVDAKKDTVVGTVTLSAEDAQPGPYLIHARVVVGLAGGATKAAVAIHEGDDAKGKIVGKAHEYPLEVGGAARQVLEFVESAEGPHAGGDAYSLTVKLPDGAGIVELPEAGLIVHQAAEDQ